MPTELDPDEAALDVSYQAHYGAYEKIFARLGLETVVVGADVGIMGGSLAHEFMVLNDAGEDTLVLCESCNYAANQQIATVTKPEPPAEEARPTEEVATPETPTIAALAAFLGVGEDRTAKAIFFVTGDGRLVTAIVRGDFEVNETKLINAVNAIATDIQVLINKGAHNILVPNAGDVGAIPEFTKESPASQAQLATQSAIFFNQRLDLALANILAANPGLNLDEFDFFDFSKNVAANAASLGITNTTDPCLKTNFTPNANCLDPVTHQITFDKFLFWDHIHPTGVVQAAWAEGLIAVAPGPTTLALVALGLGVFFFAGRRQGG